jgi:hypothetical protein
MGIILIVANNQNDRILRGFFGKNKLSTDQNWVLDMSRIKTFLITWAALITTQVVWSNIGNPISNWIYWSLTSIGFPIPLVQSILVVLPILLLLEIVVKILLLQSVAPQKFIFTQAELWPHVNQDELNRYTLELEQLGFVQLTDYTLSSPNQKSLARLFSHPNKFCFVEVFQVGDFPMVCSISCLLEKNWSLAVVNRSILSATSYAFFRHPYKLFKKIDDAPVHILFQSLLEWREQVCSNLNLELVQDVRSEVYFDKQRSNHVDRKHTLLHKSVIWALLERFWFFLNPKSEWLGDYSKFKVKR